MSKPDFDVGDLVVCVDDGRDPDTGLAVRHTHKGQVLRVAEMLPPSIVSPPRWAFRSTCEPVLALHSGTILRSCYRYRKIDKASDDWAAEWEACKPKERVK